MANTQTVIIDFQADLSSLVTGIDTLEKLGLVNSEVAATFKKTNAEIVKNGQAFDDLNKKSTSTANTFSNLSDLLKQFPKSGMNRFLLQIGNDLAKAGIKAEDFFKRVRGGGKDFDSLQKELTETKTSLSTLTAEFEKLKKKFEDTPPKVVTLKQELKKVKDEMLLLAAAGDKTSERFLQLKKRAGELDDVIKDVGSDIANAGSDTRGIDNVVGSISALAGGFSAVQGAAALFGDESENLQKALLRVNAAMALATGLQQVSNALQKEGSLARLADTAATYGQAAAQKLYAIVVGESVGVMKVFKIALASTGIGLLVLGLTALISGMGDASRATKKFKKDLEDLRTATDAARDTIQKEGEIDAALLDKAGAAASKQSKLKIENLKKEQEAEEGFLIKLDADRTRVSKELKGKNLQEVQSVIQKLNAIDEQEQTSNKNLLELRQQLRIETIKSQQQENEEKEKLDKERLDKQKELNQKALEAAKKLRALEFEDYKAGIELKLLASEKGSAEELDLQKQLLRAKLQIDLEGEGLSLNQRRLLIQQFFKDRIELEKKFNKDLVAAGIEDQKNRDSAILENLNLNEKEKLDVKIEFLQLSAAQEILAAEGNAAKILAINAKLNADISAARIESIRKTAADEAAITSIMNEPRRRALEGVANDEKMKLDVRINAINQAADIDKEAINQQIIANRKANDVIGADHKALNIEQGKLLNEYVFVSEAAQKKITAITETENEKRRQSDIANIQSTLSALGEVSNILQQFQQNSNERISNEIANKKKEVEALLEAGAITEKDAKLRNRRIEDEEKKAKTKAAQAQKSLAVFNAFITGAQAIMQAIASAPTPYNIPAIAITSALVAAQIAAIASRPVPKFASGKKGSYKGWGEVAEAGAELIQRSDGRMEVATRRQMVYLGSQDKVFTAGETKRMMPFVNKEAIAANGKSFEFDYEKLGRAVKQKQNGTVVNIDKEFISESVANGLSRVNYFDRYYNSKG